nr:SelB C-terminal domain-containing protein [Motilibacter aurantiacus]
MGVPVTGRPVAGDWLADPETWRGLRALLAEEVRRYLADHPLEPGAPVDVVRQRLDLPDRDLVEELAAGQLPARNGRLSLPAAAPSLPPAVARAVAAVEADLAVAPFRAPEADRLAQLGLGARELAAAVRVGALLKVADGVYLLPDAPARAAAALERLPAPFTLSEARRHLDTTRRVAVPFLELLDRSGVTQRLPDDRRRLRESGTP